MTVKYQELFYLLQKFLCFIVISQVKMNPFIISFIITAWSGQLATFFVILHVKYLEFSPCTRV